MTSIFWHLTGTAAVHGYMRRERYLVMRRRARVAVRCLTALDNFRRDEAKAVVAGWVYDRDDCISRAIYREFRQPYQATA